MDSPGSEQLDTFYSADTPWRAHLAELRRIVHEAGLEEAWKWRAPVYMAEGRNIAFIGHTKEGAVLSFLKGMLLPDPNGRLGSAGDNSRSAKVIRFPTVEAIRALEEEIRELLRVAVEVEAAGLKVAPPTEEPVPVAELAAHCAADAAFRKAFEALTPGRRRMYHIHFSEPKQAATRRDRIARCTPRILAGKGLNDCVCGHSKRPPGCDGSHKHFV